MERYRTCRTGRSTRNSRRSPTRASVCRLGNGKRSDSPPGKAGRRHPANRGWQTVHHVGRPGRQQERDSGAEGKYDFSASDQVIRDCRAQGLRAILLWSGSNKCGRPQSFPPKWVLADTKRFPRIIDASGNPAEPMALHAQATLEVERNACRAFMQHLKEIDGADHTVILRQVENEPGLLGHARDYSTEATRLFNAAVPSALTKALGKKPGTWKEVYPLPTLVNVWMGGGGTNDRFYDFDRPGPSYPSGGPVSHMIDLWKAVAPSIDVIAPDIYHRSAVIYRTILSRYTRRDNPLLIVETGQGMPFARYCFSALVDYSAIGFAQYGVDQGRGDNSNALADGFADVGADFRLIKNAMPVITQLQGTEKLKSANEPASRLSRTIGARLYTDRTYPCRADRTGRIPHYGI